MNTHLKQLWAAMKLPEKLQKSYKFFCRGLDIRVLDVVESFLHNIVTPCPQLCGRHTGGLHHPLSFAIWQRNAAALLIIIKL